MSFHIILFFLYTFRIDNGKKTHSNDDDDDDILSSFAVKGLRHLIDKSSNKKKKIYSLDIYCFCDNDVVTLALVEIFYFIYFFIYL